MKIFILKRDEDEVCYDEYAGKVLRAKNETEARAIANQSVGDEGKVWEDKKLVTCEVVTVAGEAGIILIDFRAD